jgi:hypothetical protein
MFNSDIFANRPNFGIPGRIFISTDTLEIYRDTGSAWNQLGGGGGGSIGGTIAAGQVAFGTATNTIGGENNLFWDSTFDRLGIGTNTPADAIEINKNFGGGLYARIRNTNAGTGSVAGINLINDAIKTGGLYLFSSLFTPNGTRGPNTLTLFSGPDTNISVAVNSTGYYSIGTGNVETEKFRVFNNGNVLIQDGGTFTDGGEKLQVSGIAKFNLNQNASTLVTISNTTSGVNSDAAIVVTSSNGSSSFSKASATRTAYKTYLPNDLGIYNGNTSGDIGILNDFATGKIKFAAGGSSTAQATLFSNGNFAINSTTDAGQRLQVVGTSQFSGNMSVSGDITTNGNFVRSGVFEGTRFETAANWGIALTNATNSGVSINNTNLATSSPTGNVNGLSLSYRFGGATSTNTNNTILINNTINQTSGSGITRGILVIPTLTLAVDWRSIEWHNNTGWGLYGVGTAPSYFAGNVQIGSTTAIANNINLQVTGLQYNVHSLTYSGLGVHTLSIFKNVTINQTITGGNGINNQRNFGSNIFASSRNVPSTTTYATIFNYNEYQFTAAGVTLSADQATGGVRTISQLTTQNVFGGSINGTMSHVSGIQINGYYNNATGTITPNITNAYQLLINDTGEFGHTFSFTNRWGIYQRGINDRNYLEGNLLLNSTTDTGQILQVNGAIRVNGQLSPTIGAPSGQHLLINCDGTTYKINLFNP